MAPLRISVMSTLIGPWLMRERARNGQSDNAIHVGA